ncbi:MAG: hypothetical protein WC436_05625 [Candidatus Babeliales bacterium]
MDTNTISSLITNPNIKIIRLREHTKASEKYVDVSFRYANGANFNTSIPYHYRRCGLFLETPSEIADLVNKIYPSCEESKRNAWIQKEELLWTKTYTSKEVTKPFFLKLLNLKWNCVESDLPKNPNWARRIQDIKELGYLLATETSQFCTKCNKNATHILLVPFDTTTPTGYESFSAALKKRIINTLNSVNAYEGKRAPSANTLIPDHKFPEIRWDAETKGQNLDTMSTDEIKKKFQLLDNQRNLHKREVCRNCFQTNKRGSIFGIKYYYAGNEDWDQTVPKTGKTAEKGCVGCPWYDVEKWREHLNKILSTS